MMIKMFSLIFILSVLMTNCNRTEHNPGIETDEDLDKSLSELIIKYPELIERDTSIETSKFRFDNNCYINENKEKLVLHSLNFDMSNREIILLTFPNGEIGKVVETKKNKFSNSDYTLNINNKYIEINRRYTNDVLFKGVECN